MKNTGIVILLFSSLLSIQGQGFLDRVSKKASQKLEQQLTKATNDSIDKSIEEDETINPEEGNSSNKEKPPKSAYSNFMNNMGASSTPAKYDNTYTFDMSFTVNIKSYDSTGKLDSDANLLSFVNSKTGTYANKVESGNLNETASDNNSIMIYDIKNESSVILTEDKGEKSGIIMGISQQMLSEDYDDTENSEDENDIAPVKTGRTKTILGYKCDEYAIKDSKMESYLWLTNDFKWTNKAFLNTIYKESFLSGSTEYGFLMENEAKDLETGEKFFYQVTDIQLKTKKVFSLDEYELTNVGTMNMEH